ncbi:hypothetical protein PtA15_5A914 [Puccinia triticina]|uniref:Calponin-homology (CH) domain-containing protein n=1 Tax=Puccinia triticina TaxID=208348 RepID=A0ABY7CJP7_9BASI|nr:uncharacterized protein PtA15_5A914 [Puccinia triticina]WAQ85339.1 hypothetical protein PtA15_5A914 [Puccinia triticina]
MLGPPNVVVVCAAKELSASNRDLLGWINDKIRARKLATASDFLGSIRNGHALVRLIEALAMADSGLSIRDFLGASHLTQLDLHRPAGPDTPDSKQGSLNFFFSHKPANQSEEKNPVHDIERLTINNNQNIMN